MAHKKILIIGGTGFIGEELVKRLEQNDSYQLSVIYHTPRQVPSDSRTTYHLIDVTTEGEKLAQAMTGQDTVIVLTQPSEQGINCIASAIALSHPPQVIYASTSLLYTSSEKPQTEDAPLTASTPYETLKLMEEESLQKVQPHGLIIARLGNVYGGLKNKGIIGKALGAMYSGESIELAGLSQLRDFTHVEDVAEALALLVEHVPATVEVVNISTGKGTTVGEMLALLESAAGKKIPQTAGKESAAAKHIIADNNKLFSITGFRPQKTLTQGLTDIHNHYARSIRK